MKKIFTVAISLYVGLLFSQAPEKMSYQAVIRNASNNLVSSQTVGMQISILQGSPVGTSVYVETQTPMTNLNGLATIEIGNGSVISGSFSTIDWANGPYYIKSETDPLGGTSYTITGTTQLLSVPYALHAKTAESISGGNSMNQFYLGQDTLGGIVYHIYTGQDGQQHGLIVSTTEITAQWQSVSSLTNASASWDGLTNTSLMTSSPAASYVNGLGSGWFLPAIDELNLLWQNRMHVNKALAAGGFSLLEQSYWSSTEDSPSNAVYLQMNSGLITLNGNKSVALLVRGVRAF